MYKLNFLGFVEKPRNFSLPLAKHPQTFTSIISRGKSWEFPRTVVVWLLFECVRRVKNQLYECL